MGITANLGLYRHVARFDQHNGNADDFGNPTYSVDDDWDTVIQQWPCQLTTTSGGEKVRGRQTTSETTHVLFGEFYGASTAEASFRAVIEGKTYGVVSVYDADGENRELRVELKREST